jgi:nucleotide-binding universal stress UspA family protein
VILVGDDSRDARVLADLLARATDGTVVRSTDAVSEAIKRQHPGVVVVRGSRRGAGAREAELLVRNAPCPVAVAPPGFGERAPSALRRVGVAFDGWDESRVALAEAAAVVEGVGGELVLLMADPPGTAASAAAWDMDPDALSGHRVAADRYLRRVVDELSSRIVTRACVLYGQVAPALLDACEAEHLDLLAFGSRRRGAVARVVLGSVGHALLREPPPCPLLLSPRGIAPPRETELLAEPVTDDSEAHRNVPGLVAGRRAHRA